MIGTSARLAHCCSLLFTLYKESKLLFNVSVSKLFRGNMTAIVWCLRAVTEDDDWHWWWNENLEKMTPIALCCPSTASFPRQVLVSNFREGERNRTILLSLCACPQLHCSTLLVIHLARPNPYFSCAQQFWLYSWGQCVDRFQRLCVQNNVHHASTIIIADFYRLLAV